MLLGSVLEHVIWFMDTVQLSKCEGGMIARALRDCLLTRSLNQLEIIGIHNAPLFTDVNSRL